MKFLEKIHSKLSVAVFPIDAFSPKEKLKGVCTIRVSGFNQTPIQNRHGYYLFLDLPELPHTITAESQYYNPVVIVDFQVDDPLWPILELELQPNTSYPFPEGTTLLRGILLDENNTPIAKAAVNDQKSDQSTLSNDNGKFVLFFKEVIEDEITVDLEIIKEGYKVEKPKYTIQKGKTKTVSITLSAK